MDRGDLVIVENAKYLHERLCVPTDRAEEIGSFVSEMLESGKGVGEIVHILWYSEDYTNEELAFALVYLGKVIGMYEGIAIGYEQCQSDILKSMTSAVQSMVSAMSGNIMPGGGMDEDSAE